MNKGKYVISQILDIVHRQTFNRIVKKYNGDYKVKKFSCWHLFICLVFGQITHRKSLRDITICLNARSDKLYHIGITNGVKRSTLIDACQKRNQQIFKDLATILMKRARLLYKGEDHSRLEIENEIYAIDSSTIDLCMSLYKWAGFMPTKSGIKLHSSLDVKTEIPNFINITDGKHSDVQFMDQLSYKANAIYLFDRAYLDYHRLNRLNDCNAIFVTRAKKNTKFRRISSKKVNKSIGLICDQVIKLISYQTKKKYPKELRRISYKSKEMNKKLVFLTNNFELEAIKIARLYEQRWKIELFFKWIKQNLTIKSFWGYSENAVRTHIWVAISTYCMIAILKKNLNVEKSMYETLQILSISPFEKTPVNQILTEEIKGNLDDSNSNQLTLW